MQCKGMQSTAITTKNTLIILNAMREKSVFEIGWVDWKACHFMIVLWLSVIWAVAMKMTMFTEHLWAVNDEGIKC